MIKWVVIDLKVSIPKEQKFKVNDLSYQLHKLVKAKQIKIKIITGGI
jgi:hypothetical protein